jgi:23S rRNA (cytidine1920-2'-O)/16S rRNA (cytidine1409-2'-O)-methyltransferase
MSGAGGARRERADRLLVQRGLAASRERAQAMILAGSVFTGDRRVEKAGERLAGDAELRVAGDPLPFVGRGGLKMAGALDRFGLDPRGWTVLDVGASTGGFTDCLLQRGVRRVYALDVGRGQLDWNLRRDPRVVVMEGVNARHLEPGAFDEPIDLAAVDVAFISLRLVVPAVRRAAAPARWVLLVKPQFEAGRGEVERGGLVRDRAKHRGILEAMLGMAATEGLVPAGLCRSPIEGAEGNREFLLHLLAGGAPPAAGEPARWIEEAIA